jgi:CRISPR system Cascade subunit CasB
MSEEKELHPFIEYLYRLARDGQRGALADLRRGLSEPPGTAPVMFPYVARWVPEDARYRWREKVYYLTAALFAYVQSGGGAAGKQRLTTGNLGDHCRRAVSQKENKSGSFEMRFAALLRANPDDLPIFLRQMISLLKSAEIPINWNQFFYDLMYWNSESRYVQNRWAHSYWGDNPEKTKTEPTETTPS